MSGGWASKELWKRASRRWCSSAAANIRHTEDYSTALKDPWELPHNNRPTNEDRKAQPIQSTLYLYDQSTKQFRQRPKYSYTRRNPSTGSAATRWVDVR